MKTLYVQKYFFIVAVLSLLIILSCSKDERPEIVRDYINKKVNQESEYSIELMNFNKTNGISKELMGQELYELEFTATVEMLRDIWKRGNPIEGYWNNFYVFLEEPSGWDRFTAGSVRHLIQGQQLILNGTINLENTENGWRVKDGFVIKNIQDGGINEEWSKTLDLNILVGNWKTVNGEKEFTIWQKGNMFLFNQNTSKGSLEKKRWGDIDVKFQYKNGAAVWYGIKYYKDKDQIFWSGDNYVRN